MPPPPPSATRKRGRPRWPPETQKEKDMEKILILTRSHDMDDGCQKIITHFYEPAKADIERHAFEMILDAENRHRAEYSNIGPLVALDDKAIEATGPCEMIDHTIKYNLIRDGNEFKMRYVVPLAAQGEELPYEELPYILSWTVYVVHPANQNTTTDQKKG